MARTLLVASSGGHLDELMVLARRRGLDTDETLWVTSRSAHTEGVLSGRQVAWQPHVGSREFGRAFRGVRGALALHRRFDPEVVVSTGAAQAVPHLLAAALSRTPIEFIESATRLGGPSKCGRLARHLPRTSLYSQESSWAEGPWHPTPWVFDSFQSEAAAGVEPRRIVFSLGSERFPFPRALAAFEPLARGRRVCWQTGTTISDGSARAQWVPATELRKEMALADVVVTHAGVGSALAAVTEGRAPVLLTRRAAHGEHVDDHQVGFARRLADLGLAVAVDPDDLTEDHLVKAARLRVVPAGPAHRTRMRVLPPQPDSPIVVPSPRSAL